VPDVAARRRHLLELTLHLDPEGLTQPIESADRNAYLKRLHDDALVAQNGSGLM